MSKVIIGIDPDSKAHGVAVYLNGYIKSLLNVTLFQLYEYIEQDYQHLGDVEIHMEDTCANNAVFRKGNCVKVQQSIARRLGMVQQSQVEIERMAKYIGVKIVKHKISKVWKKDKAQFEKVTGWVGRSNEDNRSAAYFGWLGLKG